MRNLKFFWVGVWLAFGFGLVGAQNYPAQPIKLIQPFAPGAASEVALRIVAERLSAALKTTVLIENRPGAGSTLGADSVAKASPDGYTLLASYNSSIAPGPLMYAKIPYDPIKDFQHIALIGVYPQYLIVRADHPAKSIQDFLATVRTKPGTVNYASAGVGTSGFLVAQANAVFANDPHSLQGPRTSHHRSVGRASGHGADRQCHRVGQGGQGQGVGSEQ
jgi:tripartite-type tricarboxylate transporter receptor subunit TctC